MFCSQCGTENSDNAVFCKECGHKMIDGNKSADAEKPLVTHNSVLEEIASSKLFLALAILSTICICLGYSGSFVTSINGVSGIVTAVSSIAGTTFSSLFSIITVVCLWLIYGNAKNGKGINVSGLKTIAVLEKIKFIFGIIFALITALSAVSLAIVYAIASDTFKNISIEEIISKIQIPDEISEVIPNLDIMIDDFVKKYSSEQIISFAIVTVITMLIIFTVVLVVKSVFSKIINTQVKNVIEDVNTNRFSGKISFALTVFLVLAAVISFFGFGISNILKAASFILAIVIINKVNGKYYEFNK